MTGSCHVPAYRKSVRPCEYVDEYGLLVPCTKLAGHEGEHERVNYFAPRVTVDEF